jgi:hypothetical protein
MNTVATDIMREHAQRKSLSRSRLNHQDLRLLAPSIVAQAPHERVSDRYNFLDTMEVVRGLESEGYFPVAASESRVRDHSRRGFQRHMVRFQHGDHIRAGRRETPEILLINGHDASTSFRIEGGLFRLVCSNGLVIKDASFGSIRVNHLADAGEVIDAALEVPSLMGGIADNIDAMRGHALTFPERSEFAAEAVKLRWPEGAPIDPERMLQPRRGSDAGGSLWTVYNVVQENLVKGGARYVTGGGIVDGEYKPRRRRSVATVRGIDQDVRINQGLWTLAQGYLN